jgi:hypothetical protein
LFKLTKALDVQRVAQDHCHQLAKCEFDRHCILIQFLTVDWWRCN